MMQPVEIELAAWHRNELGPPSASLYRSLCREMTSRPVIAVVDDEEMIRRVLARILETADFQAVAFDSGEGFLKWLASNTPACVVLDFKMPGLDGRAVQREVGRTHPKLPVIVLSAHDDPGLVAQFLEGGAAAFLLKPLQRQILLDTLNAVLHL